MLFGKTYQPQHALVDDTWNRTSEPLATDNTTSSALHVASSSIIQNVTGNVSVPEGCYVFNFEDMEFLPWDNPDNIVSAEVEEMTRRLKDTLFLPILFLIGGPANVINMAVFYKQGLKDRVNLCLFALSLADELYLIQAMFLFGEQLQLQFTTKERFGPMTIFMINKNLVGFYGFGWVSQIMSAIIASERCLCVLSPLRFQTLLKTKNMAIVITTVYLSVVGLYFFVAARYRIACVFDPTSDTVRYAEVAGEFYQNHEEIINYLDSFVFGIGISGAVSFVVTITTITTAMKIRQAALWRAGTSSTSSSSTLTISPRELALTKMLIGNSVLFTVCLFPLSVLRVVWFALPDMDVGRRHHNFYMTIQWIEEIFSYVNSAFNIVVYYTMGSRYRDTLWEIFGRKKRGKAKGTPRTEAKPTKETTTDACTLNSAVPYS